MLRRSRVRLNVYLNVEGVGVTVIGGNGPRDVGVSKLIRRARPVALGLARM